MKYLLPICLLFFCNHLSGQKIIDHVRLSYLQTRHSHFPGWVKGFEAKVGREWTKVLHIEFGGGYIPKNNAIVGDFINKKTKATEESVNLDLMLMLRITKGKKTEMSYGLGFGYIFNRVRYPIHSIVAGKYVYSVVYQKENLQIPTLNFEGGFSVYLTKRLDLNLSVHVKFPLAKDPLPVTYEKGSSELTIMNNAQIIAGLKYSVRYDLFANKEPSTPTEE